MSVKKGWTLPHAPEPAAHTSRRLAEPGDGREDRRWFLLLDVLSHPRHAGVARIADDFLADMAPKHRFVERELPAIFPQIRSRAPYPCPPNALLVPPTSPWGAPSCIGAPNGP